MNLSDEMFEGKVKPGARRRRSKLVQKKHLDITVTIPLRVSFGENEPSWDAVFKALNMVRWSLSFVNFKAVDAEQTGDIYYTEKP